MSDRQGVTIRRQDEFERTGNWLLARRSLGLSAFGMNVVEIPPGERIPEHDETERDHEEVFIVLDGEPALVVEGEEIPAPAGTYARMDPHVRRTVANNGSGPATVLICSAPRSSGYEPMDWA
jgi:quercetin dioxygenase-like cupin family protein